MLSSMSISRCLLLFETFEERRCLTGTVNVAVTGNLIRVTGDATDSQIEIARPDNGSGEPLQGAIIYVPYDIRLIVGGKEVDDGVETLTSRDGYDLLVELGNGHDRLDITGGAFFGNVNIDMGNGDDSFDSNAIYRNIVVKGGDGTDRISFTGGSALRTELSVLGNASFLPGAGRDWIDFTVSEPNYPVAFGGKLLIEDRSGPLHFAGVAVYVRRQAVIATGNSIDRISLTNSIFRSSLVIESRHGPNRIDLADSKFSQQPVIIQRDEDDVVTGLSNGL